MDLPGAPMDIQPTPQRILTVETAARICRNRGTRLTTIRRAVLEILAQERKPFGAYELLDKLADALGKRFLPPTIYRTLEFFVEHGLVARIESRNAYVLIDDPDHPHSSIFFVCDQCSSSVEIENSSLASLIAGNASSLGFHVVKPVIECTGTCSRCSDAT